MGRRRRLLLGAALAAPVAVAVARGLRASRTPPAEGVPAPVPSAGLVGAVALDELISMPMGLLGSMGSEAVYRRAIEERDAALVHYRGRGWLDDPAGRHPAPPAAVDVEVVGDVARFDSGWEPEPGEPGADRWRSFAANGTVTVRLLRHPGGPRPWLIAVHGQGMGRPRDERMLRVRHLHERLGINIALPVLPLHGPRRAGWAPDEQFVSTLFLVSNVFGLTQGVWDLRRLAGWLRDDQGAPAVGALGLSLGSIAVSLLSTYEPDLASVIAIVPTSDLAGALRRAEPLTFVQRAWHRSLHDERGAAVLSVVSPLARPCLVRPEGRTIVAGAVDRIAYPPDAAELWHHWGEPTMLWRQRGHVTSARSAEYDDHVAAVLERSLLCVS